MAIFDNKYSAKPALFAMADVLNTPLQLKTTDETAALPSSATPSTVPGRGPGRCVFPATCAAPASSRHSAVADVQSRAQWPDADGYCGALSVQSIAMSHGNWISQDVVRWAPEFGGRNGFPPPEKSELVLSIETGCARTVLFLSEPNTPYAF